MKNLDITTGSLIGDQMRVSLDSYARTGIEAQIGPDVTAGIRTAIFHYAYKLKTGRPPISIPRFLRRKPAEPAVFEIALSGETAALFEQEAARQGASLSDLVNHSVLVYLAELDFLSSAARESGSLVGTRV